MCHSGPFNISPHKEVDCRQPRRRPSHLIYNYTPGKHLQLYPRVKHLQLYPRKTLTTIFIAAHILQEDVQEFIGFVYKIQAYNT